MSVILVQVWFSMDAIFMSKKIEALTVTSPAGPGDDS